MSSEAITRNDLTNILNEVLPPTPSEYRTLLWANASPTSNFAAQTISLNLSDYDAVDIEMNSSTTAGGGTYRVSIGGTGLGMMNSAVFTSMRWRYFSANSTGVTFGDGYLGSTANNSYAIPIYIYGVNYNMVAQPQEVADYIVEQGTSDIWTYRKWDSGIAELWASASQTVTAYASNLFIIGSETVTPYPFAITSPKAQAYCVRLSSGLGIISYDYNRTDYWSAVCCSVNQSIAQGQSREIVYNLYIMAKWK